MLFKGAIQDDAIEKYRDDFLSSFDKIKRESETDYIAAIQGLPVHISEKGTLWLQKIVDIFCEKTKTIMPSLNMFSK